MEEFADRFDAKVAERFVASSLSATGLPAYLGIEFVDMGPGRLTARLPVRDELLTPFGNLHGGVMAGFVDHVLGCVLYPLMERGQWAATTEFKLNYMAAVRGGELMATSTVLSLAKRTAVIRVDVVNDGRLACVAQGTLLVVDPQGGGS